MAATLIHSSMARGMFPVTPSASNLTNKAYGVVFSAGGTFTGVTEMGDNVTLTVVASQTVPAVFTKITAAPAGTYGYKLF
jgi:hypothetical protein